MNLLGFICLDNDLCIHWTNHTSIIFKLSYQPEIVHKKYKLFVLCEI